MALVRNKNFDETKPESATNQRFIFSDSSTIINPQTGQTAGGATATPTTAGATRQVTLPRGQVVQIDEKGNIVGGLDESTRNQIKDTKTEEDQSLDDIIAGGNLTADEEELLRFMFDVGQSFDKDAAKRLTEGLESAREFADPIFKAKLSLARDAMQRGFVSADKALEFEELQKANTLKDLREDVSASKEFLDFEQSQQLKNLEKQFETDLEDTRQSLAAKGKTVSSVRSRAESLLTGQKEGLVESTKRKFGFEAGRLERGLAREERDIPTELERLRELTTEKKTGIFRTAEERLGTAGLPDIGGFVPLGGVAGSFEKERASDIKSFITNFVF